MQAKEFEQLCIFAMEAVERAGQATMTRYGVQTSLVDGQLRPIQSLPDFEGVLRGGRQFVFDCKVCSQASLPLHKSHVTERQLKHLLKRARFGAICFLLIHWNERRLKRRLEPARTVAFPVRPDLPFWERFEAAETLHRSINRAACDEYGQEIPWWTPERARKPRPDLLAGIRALEVSLTADAER